MEVHPEPAEPGKARKRHRRPDKWKRALEKAKRYSAKGLPIPPACGHANRRFKCAELTMADMKAFHETFNATKNKQDQDAFLLKYCNTATSKIKGSNSSKTTSHETTKNHPAINVTRDHHHHTRDEGVSMYLEVEDNLLKRITSVWYKQGIVEALSTAADPSVNRDSPNIALVASYALKLASALARFRYFLQPHLKDNGPKVIAKFSRTRNWSNSPVRCLAWHPQVTKIAVATADDHVRVYASDTAFVSVLKCGAQANVSAVAWRPYSSSEIAVGCEQGVIVWTVDPNSMFTKPSSSNAVVLKRSGHSPVTDVSWSPRGDVLVSCSAADASLLVWDVAMATAVPLRRVAGGGVAFALYSCDATSLFSASSSMVFRVWDAREPWRLRRWVTRGGRVLAACRCPQDVWLFAVEGESLIYMLNSKVEPLPGNKVNNAVAVLDVGRGETAGLPAGGALLDMCWDPTGRYLALLFHDSSAVAVFTTTHLLMQLQVTPCCLVTGLEEELPSSAAFQQNFPAGACLTIAWSSGRLQHFPILYTDPY